MFWAYMGSIDVLVFPLYLQSVDNDIAHGIAEPQWQCLGKGSIPTRKKRTMATCRGDVALKSSSFVDEGDADATMYRSSEPSSPLVSPHDHQQIFAGTESYLHRPATLL